MSERTPVYDLGEVGDSSPDATAAEIRRIAGTPAADPLQENNPRIRVLREYPPPTARLGSRRPGPALTGSLSLIVPGSGQMLAGEPASGLFVLTSLGLMGALGWAVLASFDRLVSTLELVGISSQVPIWALVALYLSAAILHVSAVVHAQALAFRSSTAREHHPVLAGVASSLIPGWGQVLNGHRIKAAIFLGGTWILAAAWLARTAPVHSALKQLNPPLQGSPFLEWWTHALLVVSAVLWSLAVYDAAAAAIYSRRD